jgi:hypothetical protein
MPKDNFLELNKWIDSLDWRCKTYSVANPIFKYLGVRIKSYGEKKILYFKFSDSNRSFCDIGNYSDYSKSKALFKKFYQKNTLMFRLLMRISDYYDYNFNKEFGNIIIAEEREKIFGRCPTAKRPIKYEEKIFATPVEAKPSETNRDVPEFKVVVAQEYITKNTNTRKIK